MKQTWKQKVRVILLAGMLLMGCNSGPSNPNADKTGNSAPASGIQEPNSRPEKSAVPLYDPAKALPTATDVPGAPTPTKKPSPVVKPTIGNNTIAKASPYNGLAVAQTDIQSATANAQKDGKLVLLDFGANWCPDCLVLSKLLEDPSVKPFLEDHFYTARIDVGYWDKNLDVVQKYGNPIKKGIPAVVILAPNGNILATTDDGALANARTASAADILGYLKAWAAKKH